MVFKKCHNVSKTDFSDQLNKQEGHSGAKLLSSLWSKNIQVILLMLTQKIW